MFESFDLRRLVRFNLGTLLWITLCTCGYFGAYRAGQLAAQRDKLNELPIARIYDVSDIMAGLPVPVRDRTYRELCAHLRAALPPSAWTGNSAVQCGIHPFGATSAVAVLQRRPAHESVAAALESFRRRTPAVASIK